jgi:hypothetical protein
MISMPGWIYTRTDGPVADRVRQVILPSMLLMPEGTVILPALERLN